jgi:hypothetical protein
LSLRVDLAGLQASLFVRLQRLLDVLAVSVLGAERVDDAAYASFATFININPAANQRLSREAAVKEAADWYLRCVFRDAIEATGEFLEGCRNVAAIYATAGSGKLTVGEFQKIVGIAAKKFHKLGLPEKIRQLRDDFGVSAELSGHVLTINRVRNCLVHRFGAVRAQDLDQDGELKLRWRVFEFFGESADGSHQVIVDGPIVLEEGWSLKLRAADRGRVFKLGDRVTLSYGEITHTMMTLMQFAIEVTEALKQKGPQGQPADAEPARGIS